MPAKSPFAKKKGGSKTKTKNKTSPSSKPKKVASTNSVKRSPFRKICAALAAASFITVICMSFAMLAGCTTTSVGGKNLHIVDLRDNSSDSPGVGLRIGYFGGCLTVNHTSNSTDFAHCIRNLRGHDADIIAEELTKPMGLQGGDASKVIYALNTTLVPLAVHLQSDVFHWEPPVFQSIAFLASGLLLGFGVTAKPSAKRSYKVFLISGILLSMVAFSLAFVTSIGASEALNALRYESFGGVVFERGHMLRFIQITHVALTGLFYVWIAALFANNKSKSIHAV